MRTTIGHSQRALTLILRSTKGYGASRPARREPPQQAAPSAFHCHQKIGRSSARPELRRWTEVKTRKKILLRDVAHPKLPTHPIHRPS